MIRLFLNNEFQRICYKDAKPVLIIHTFLWSD